jgi:hypothetical protein
MERDAYCRYEDYTDKSGNEKQSERWDFSTGSGPSRLEKMGDSNGTVAAKLDAKFKDLLSGGSTKPEPKTNGKGSTRRGREKVTVPEEESDDTDNQDGVPF